MAERQDHMNRLSHLKEALDSGKELYLVNDPTPEFGRVRAFKEGATYRLVDDGGPLADVEVGDTLGFARAFRRGEWWAEWTNQGKL